MWFPKCIPRWEIVLFSQCFSWPDAPQWQTTYEDEMKSLCNHKVWDLVPHDQVPAGWKVIPSKPVFHYKCDSDGKIIWHKVHVVAKGFAQKPGRDYMDTYVPFVCIESTWVLLHMEQPKGMKEPGRNLGSVTWRKLSRTHACCACLELSSTPCNARNWLHTHLCQPLHIYVQQPNRQVHHHDPHQQHVHNC